VTGEMKAAFEKAQRDVECLERMLKLVEELNGLFLQETEEGWYWKRGIEEQAVGCFG